MNCYLHSDRPTVAACSSCGNLICGECDVNVGGRHYCKTCLAEATDVPKEPSNNPGAAVRRLTRSADDCVIAGVCGGFAKYANFDPTLVRIVYCLATLLSIGLGVIGYLVAWAIVPGDREMPGFSGRMLGCFIVITGLFCLFLVGSCVRMKIHPF